MCRLRWFCGLASPLLSPVLSYPQLPPWQGGLLPASRRTCERLPVSMAWVAARLGVEASAGATPLLLLPGAAAQQGVVCASSLARRRRHQGRRRPARLVRRRGGRLNAEASTGAAPLLLVQSAAARRGERGRKVVARQIGSASRNSQGIRRCHHHLIAAATAEAPKSSLSLGQRGEAVASREDGKGRRLPISSRKSR